MSEQLASVLVQPDMADRVNPNSDIDLEWAETFCKDHTYLGQIDTTEEESFRAGLEKMTNLRQQYGAGNAIANVLSLGDDGFGRTPGTLGMWVDTAALIKAERGEIPSPFIGELRGTDLAADSYMTKDKVIREIEGVPDMLVRVGGTERDRLRELHVVLDKETHEVIRSFRTPTYSKEIHDKYVTGLALFKERSESPYNIAYPRSSAIVAKDPEDGNDKVMLVTEKVDGLALADALEAAPNDAELISKTSAWLEGTAKYLSDKSKGGDFLYDFGLRQYMYGITKSDPEPKIYCVDLDMWYEHFDGMDEPSAEKTLGSEFYALGHAIDFVDQISPSVDTSNAKARLREFLGAIPQATQPRLSEVAQVIRSNFPWAAEAET